MGVFLTRQKRKKFKKDNSIKSNALKYIVKKILPEYKK